MKAASCVLLIVSALVLIGAAAFLIFKHKNRIWYIAGSVFSSVVFLQASLGFAYGGDYGGGLLSGPQIFARTVAHIFQTFSLDAAYVEIVGVATTAYSGFFTYLYYAVSCALTVLAPVTGGFAIFGVLCHFFPYLRLYFSLRRTKVVFSELNERSIETAESIYESAYKTKTKKKTDATRLKNPLIIFSDAYLDDEEEKVAELFDRAKAIGAVCIRDDVLTLRIPHWTRLVYFLMDVEEENNIATAVSLLSDSDGKKRKSYRSKWRAVIASKYERFRKRYERALKRGDGARVGAVGGKEMQTYVFTRDDRAGGVIEELLKTVEREALTEAEKATPDIIEKWKRSVGSLGVTVKVINEYRNLVYRLIDKPQTGPCADDAYPLYMSKIGCYAAGESSPEKGSAPAELDIAVIGGGRVAQEFIKASYWCGQMLDPRGKTENGKPATVKLRISVLSLDADKTEKKLRFEMPEAFSEWGKSFCEFRFCKTEYGTAKPFSENGKENDPATEIPFDHAFGKLCSKADYVLVALGNDELNFQAANWVKRSFDAANVASPRRVPVNFIIENANLCEALSRSATRGNPSGCVLHPFGSLRQQFSYDNVYMTAIEQRAQKIHEAYGNSRCDFASSAYNRNSSMAAALHASYKFASLGLAENYSQPKNTDDMEKIYWLEHRRWCAYIQTTGYRRPTAYEFAHYAFERDESGVLKPRVDSGGKFVHKESSLELHSCLCDTGCGFPSAEQIMKDWETGGGSRDALLESVEKSTGKTTGSLEEWLRKNVKLSSYRDAAQKFEYDTLDRLGLVAKVFSQSSDAGDFKRNDMTTAKNSMSVLGKYDPFDK